MILFIQAIWRRLAFGTQVKARAFLAGWLHPFFTFTEHILVQNPSHAVYICMPQPCLSCIMHDAQPLSAPTTVPNHSTLLRISLAHIRHLCAAYTTNTPHLLLFCFACWLPPYLFLVQQLKKSCQHLWPLLSLPESDKPTLDITSQYLARYGVLDLHEIHFFFSITS